MTKKINWAYKVTILIYNPKRTKILKKAESFFYKEDGNAEEFAKHEYQHLVADVECKHEAKIIVSDHKGVYLSHTSHKGK